MDDEVQKHLDYIRNMGITAWIPGTRGYGPVMSIQDQCRSGVLCLKYNGLDIYLKGKKSVCENTPPRLVRNYDRIRYFEMENRTYNVTESPTNSPLKTRSKPITAELSTRTVGVQCGNSYDIHTSFKRAASPMKTIDDYLGVNKTFTPEGGAQYRRVVNQKITKEVRVGKCYVSSLPNTIVHESLSSDRSKASTNVEDKSETAINKSGPKPGFVKELAKRFSID